MKVNLKIKEGNTVQTEQHEIEEVNLMQLTRAIKVIKDILDVVRKDEHLQSLLEEIFFDTTEETEGEEAEEKLRSPEDLFTQDFASNLVGAIDVLLVEVPEKAFELLSVLSNIEFETFMQQKAEDVFDIYDAVIEVNDIERLVNRAKKSLRLTKAQKKVMNLFQKKSETTVVEPV